MSGPDPLPLIPDPGWLGAVIEAVAAAVTAANVAHLQGIADAVNPGNGTINCGNIIDAVIARETGADPNATAPTGIDGSWSDIETRHNTSIQWGSSFQAAYDAVAAGGPGTIALVGIDRPNGAMGHVVTLINHNGTVGIVEGQGTPTVITDATAANQAYNSSGANDIGFGIVGSNP